MKPSLCVVIDSRERAPYSFPGVDTVIDALKAGDYSLKGLEARVSVERKRLQELFAITGRDRERFKRELERMAALDYAALVIEADLPHILRGAAFSQVSPKAVIRSLVSWSIRYRVFVFFAGDRRYANALTYRLLEQYWNHHHDQTPKGQAP